MTKQFYPHLAPLRTNLSLTEQITENTLQAASFHNALKAYREFLTLKDSIRNDSPFRIGKSAAISCLVCIFLLFGEKRGKRYSVPNYLVDSLGDEKIAKKIIIKLKSHSSFKKVVRYVKGCCHQMSLTTTDAKTST